MKQTKNANVFLANCQTWVNTNMFAPIRVRIADGQLAVELTNGFSTTFCIYSKVLILGKVIKVISSYEKLSIAMFSLKTLVWCLFRKNLQFPGGIIFYI